MWSPLKVLIEKTLFLTFVSHTNTPINSHHWKYPLAILATNCIFSVLRLQFPIVGNRRCTLKLYDDHCNALQYFPQIPRTTTMTSWTVTPCAWSATGSLNPDSTSARPSRPGSGACRTSSARRGWPSQLQTMPQCLQVRSSPPCFFMTRLVSLYLSSLCSVALARSIAFII